MTVQVLVVDEDEEVLDVTEAFLSRQDGLDVTAETDPEAALERLLDGEFEAVVSDMTMPELDGLEMCERLREADSDIPFFLFSGSDHETIEKKSGSGCITGYVRKSTGSDQYERLGEEIRSAVNGQ